MSYELTITGLGAPPKDVEEAFIKLVLSLRAATPAEASTMPVGYMDAYDVEGNNTNLTAADINADGSVVPEPTVEPEEPAPPPIPDAGGGI